MHLFPILVLRWCKVTHWVSESLNVEYHCIDCWIVIVTKCRTWDVEKLSEDKDPRAKEEQENPHVPNAGQNELNKLTEALIYFEVVHEFDETSHN